MPEKDSKGMTKRNDFLVEPDDGPCDCGCMDEQDEGAEEAWEDEEDDDAAEDTEERYVNTWKFHTMNDSEDDGMTRVRANTTKEAVQNAAQEGAKLAASRRVAAKVTSKVRDMLGDSYPAALDTPLGRMVEPLLIPLAVHYLVTCKVDVPNRANIQAVCELALTAGFDDIASGLLDKFGPQLADIGNITA